MKGIRHLATSHIDTMNIKQKCGSDDKVCAAGTTIGHENLAQRSELKCSSIFMIKRSVN